MKFINKIFLGWLLLIIVLGGCIKENEIIPTNQTLLDSSAMITFTPTPTISELNQTPIPIPTTEIVYPEISATPIISTELQPNEFIAKDIKVGDSIVGLKVATIKRDTIGPGS